MYRVRLHYSHVGWAFHRRCVALQKYAPDDFEVDIAQWHPCLERTPMTKDYDLFLNLVPDHPALRLSLFPVAMSHPQAIIVGGLNVGWGHHEERLAMQQSADYIIVNNRELWERLDRPEGMTWISNGVDLDTFRITRPVAERTPRVLWTGCTHHCTRTSIKGWGEVLRPLQKMLTEVGVESSFRMTDAGNPSERYTTEQMVEWYNTGTIYVCASSSEGTPNPLLEAAACGCVPVSTRVGNAPELIHQYWNGELVDRNPREMFDAIVRCQRRNVVMSKEMLWRLHNRGWHWECKADQYFSLFRKLIDAKSKATV